MNRRKVLMPFVAMFVCVSAHQSYCQTRQEWRQTESAADDSPQVSKRYNGVTPGSGNTLPEIESLLKKSGAWVTWPGFTTAPDGGTRLFLQTTHELDYKVQQKKDGTIVIDLNKTRVYLGNNRNPLVTTHFNTPLRRAYLKQRRSASTLVLEMKVTATPAISQITNADGFSYLFVDFPPGDYPVENPS
jgi:hypothetical protein